MQALRNALSAPHPLDLAELALPAQLRIAVLAPHPDDFDAIGVSLRHLARAGHQLHLAVLTSGASGVEDGFPGAQTNAGKAALREAEQRASCNFFGLSEDRLRFLRLWENVGVDPDHDAASRAQLRSYLLATRPDLVFLPHGNDSNRTHRRTYTSLRSIAQQESLELSAFLNCDAKTISMRADLYMYFGEEEATWKAELLRFHRSQHTRNLITRGIGFDQRVLNLNRESAAKAKGNAPYAEVFEIEHFG